MQHIKSIALLLLLACAGAQASIVDSVASTPELATLLAAVSQVAVSVTDRGDAVSRGAWRSRQTWRLNYSSAASLRQLSRSPCCSQYPKTNTRVRSARCQCFLQYDDIVTMLGNDFSGTVFLPNNAVSGAGALARCRRCRRRPIAAAPARTAQGWRFWRQVAATRYFTWAHCNLECCPLFCSSARLLCPHKTAGVCRRNGRCRCRWPRAEPGADQKDHREWYTAAGWGSAGSRCLGWDLSSAHLPAPHTLPCPPVSLPAH